MIYRVTLSLSTILRIFEPQDFEAGDSYKKDSYKKRFKENKEKNKEFAGKTGTEWRFSAFGNREFLVRFAVSDEKSSFL